MCDTPKRRSKRNKKNPTKDSLSEAVQRILEQIMYIIICISFVYVRSSGAIFKCGILQNIGAKFLVNL